MSNQSNESYFHLCTIEDLPTIFLQNQNTTHVRVVGEAALFNPLQVYFVLNDHLLSADTVPLYVDLSLLGPMQPCWSEGNALEISGELLRNPLFSRPSMPGCQSPFFLQAHIVTVVNGLDRRLHHETLKIVREHLQRR
jgi:hypothetical protein